MRFRKCVIAFQFPGSPLYVPSTQYFNATEIRRKFPGYRERGINPDIIPGNPGWLAGMGNVDVPGGSGMRIP